MIAIQLSVPIACWRKGPAREFLETEVVPPPATCYGALLSLVGETDRERHRGCRMTAGILNDPVRSVVLRTLWRVKNAKLLPGQGANARPDFQQLVTNVDLVIWCDSHEEVGPEPSLEARATNAMRTPADVERFGGWSLGESTHLVNDASLLANAAPPATCRVYLEHPEGDLTLPVWVDHVGSEDTRHTTGRLEAISLAPPSHRIPRIPVSVSERSGDP